MFDGLLWSMYIGGQGTLHCHGAVQGAQAAVDPGTEALRRRRHHERCGVPQRTPAGLRPGP